jgi:LAO/AO transport system kinase
MAATARPNRLPGATPNLDALKADFGTAAGKALIARALAALEAGPQAPETISLLDAAHADPAALEASVVGLTGPPGVGKSTLTGALIRAWRNAGRTVGVIAVDPSSRRTGGALLGDRTRLATDPDDTGLYVRSMAARDRLGGLADLTMPALVLFRALFDVVVVETVGVGQSEADVAQVADTVVLCLQPGSGDALQFMKAGIIEIPDIFVVNKADLGDLATRTKADIDAALDLSDDRSRPPVIATSAARGTGVQDLAEAVDRHRQTLDGEILSGRRVAQTEDWMRDAVRARFGADGLARAGAIDVHDGKGPFASLSEIFESLAGA